MFDYELKKSYSIRIRSTDQGGLYKEKMFTIGVINVSELAALDRVFASLGEDVELICTPASPAEMS
jgi:hypothetical protein